MSTTNKAKRLISQLLGENDALVQVTRRLSEILNSHTDSDLEASRDGSGDEDSEDLSFFRSEIFEWIHNSKKLLSGNDEALRALDTVGYAVRHYMHHETRDCLYNIGETWAKFLRKNNTGQMPQMPQMMDGE